MLLAALMDLKTHELYNYKQASNFFFFSFSKTEVLWGQAHDGDWKLIMTLSAATWSSYMEMSTSYFMDFNKLMVKANADG